MDLQALRADVPALAETVYLNTGASGPSPRHVVDAAREFLAYHEYEAPAGEGMYVAAEDVYVETRAAVADLLGATPAEIALTQSTTDGINRVASAIDWAETERVVRTDLEHAAGVLPWDRLADQYGLEVEVLETRDGRLDLDDLTAAVTDATLVTLSSITWTHGTRLPVAEAVDVAHDAGATVLVDAVQSPGQTPVDVREWGADFVAAAGHKWLLSPWGTGFLYVRDGVADAFEPRQIGYRSVEGEGVTGYRYKPGAHRFEVGTTSPAPYVGLQASIETLTDIGLDAVEARIRELTDYLKAELGEERLLSPRRYESGLVTFEAADPDALVERLAERGVQIRALPSPRAVRASVHAVNTRADVDALLDALPE
ncbi:MAG: aminotransferase class V-fold PLP-dependent enzyme [Haloferacaceae archaeon]